MNPSPLKLDLILAVGIVLLVVGILLNHRRSTVSPGTAPADLGLQTLIERVKAELVSTEQRRLGAGEDPLFELREVDLEVNFVVEENHKGSGAFDLKVATVGGESQFGSEKIQKIRIHMVTSKPQAHTETASEEPLAVDESTVVVGETPRKEK